MTESRYPDPEDEAFNEIERQAKQRKEAVLNALHSENERLGLYQEAYRNGDLNPYRAQVIEEIAQHIEKMQGFGQDTISSFAIYIRGVK
jgi:plasmid stabilization system protein ParE